MQTVVITQRGGEPAKLSCAGCGGENLRYLEAVTTKYTIRGLDGHTLRIAGVGEIDAAHSERLVCEDCSEELEMPAWMETEMSET